MDNTEEIECWKVLKRQNVSGKLVSCVVTGPVQTEYREGVWNRSDSRLSDLGYDICVFGDKDIATKFFSAYDGRYSYCEYELWRCRGRGQHRASGFVNPSNLRRAMLARSLLSRMDAAIYVLRQSRGLNVTFPTGTIMVKELMLEERVE